MKYKNDKNVGYSSTTTDLLDNVEGEINAPNGPNHPEDRIDLSSAGVENHETEDDGNQISENSQYQLVVYDPAVNGGDTGANTPDPVSASPIRRIHPFSDRTPRVLPSVGAFTVQCAICLKWRLIPTKEKYEEIREHNVEQPFLCETARQWRPNVSCDDPPDLSPDGSRLWAIDRPNIAQPPSGWQRLLRIRGEGSARFADVYYVAPSGKRLRSMVDIQKYLEKYPEFIQEGVSLSKFSFQIPKPLQENYVRKRPTRPALSNDTGDLVMPGYLPPPEAARISWRSPDVDTDLQVSGSGLSNGHFEAPSKTQSTKRRRMPFNWMCDDDLVYDQRDVGVEAPQSI